MPCVYLDVNEGSSKLLCDWLFGPRERLSCISFTYCESCTTRFVRCLICWSLLLSNCEILPTSPPRCLLVWGGVYMSYFTNPESGDCF